VRQTGQSSAFSEVPQGQHYPALDWPVIVMAKQFSSRTRTGPHSHGRGQLMFPKTGFVVASTAAGTWFVPRGHALWMPRALCHDISMHSDVSMLAAYVDSSESAGLPDRARVMKVGNLLAATLDALADETRKAGKTERTDHLAWLIVDEIVGAPSTPFVLPLPEDARLARVTQALIADPGSDRTIDQWCDLAGLSRRSMTRLFRSQTGLSFGDWRCRLRLLTAIARVADGEPLARITASLGYRSVAAFRGMASRYSATDLLDRNTVGRPTSHLGSKFEQGAKCR
jgi:AraC-like DNA-binding protein